MNRIIQKALNAQVEINRLVWAMNMRPSWFVGWVPVEEELPDPWETVLITYKKQEQDNDCFTGMAYVDEQGIWRGGPYRWNQLIVLAWAELPEPYDPDSKWEVR